jgi:hypothetical protein
VPKLTEDIKSENQVKSKKRVADHGEVFTNQREVNAMLDLVKDETERIDSRFLEPACGNGNFLAEVLRRKLAVVDRRYSKSQIEWEQNAVIAISSIYGVDILDDNAQECRARLFTILNDRYNSLFKENSKDEFRRSVNFILKINIIWGDATNYCIPKTTKPIVFAEWTPIADKIQRKDWVFEALAKGSYQTSMFDENNQVQNFDQFIKSYKPIHFLKLGEDDSDKLQP